VTSRRLATVLAAVVLPLALTACGSGRSPHTYEERPTVDAAQASLGSLQLRNISIAPPAGGEKDLAVGGTARATMAIINTGSAADQLTSVSSPVATFVAVLGKDLAATPSLEVPKFGMLTSSDFSLELRGLTQAIRPGQSVEMTFTFAQGGVKTLLVPVAVYASPEATPSVDPFQETTETQG
jgi:copper(I)-binding protein